MMGVVHTPDAPGWKGPPKHKDTDGGDGYDGGMEARVAKLEAAAEHMQADLKDLKADVREIRKDAREDFRILFGSIVVAALGLAGLMAKGFHWL